MMKDELERTLGESVSEDVFQLLQAVYLSDAAPTLGGEEGRQYLKTYFRKNRVQVEAMAGVLNAARGLGMAVEEEVRRARHGIDMLNRDANALRADVVKRMNEEKTLRDALRGAQAEARSKDLDVQIATSERDRLSAAMVHLATTLDLMGLDVEKVAKLAAGVAANQAIAGECEGALNEQGRWAQSVGSVLTYEFTSQARALKQYEIEAEARAQKRRDDGLIEQIKSETRAQVPA